MILLSLHGALRYRNETMICLNEAMRLVIKSLTCVVMLLMPLLMFLLLLKMKTTSVNMCSLVVISAHLSSFSFKIFRS